MRVLHNELVLSRCAVKQMLFRVPEDLHRKLMLRAGREGAA